MGNDRSVLPSDEKEARGLWIFLLCVLVAVPSAIPAFAQERGGRYSLSGDVHYGGRFERRTENDNPPIDTYQLRQGYSLTGIGPIYDSRLASFSLTGSLNFDNTKINPGADQDLRAWSVFSSLSLLSATRFPLGLRFGRSAGEANETSSTGTSYGATWNAEFKEFPSLQVSYDHSENESEQSLGTRSLTLDSRRIRLSKRFTRSNYELDYERRDVEDNLGFSETGDHGRFNASHRLSRAWSVNTNALLDREEREATFGGNDSQNLAVSSSVNYLPSPDLSATGSAHYSRTEVGNDLSQVAGGSGNASKRFLIVPQLEGNAFVSGLGTWVGSKSGGGDIFWSGSIGGDLASTQIEAVRAASGYSVSVSKGAASSVASVGGVAVGPADREELQTAQHINLNLASRTLDPYTVSGDYTYILEQGALDRQTHRASLQTTGTPWVGLNFRVRVEGSVTDNPEVLLASGDFSSTYSPRFNLSLTSGASASRIEAGDQVTTILRIPLTFQYQPWRSTTLFLEGFREDITNTVGPDRINHEARFRVEQFIRLIRLGLEFRFQDTESENSRTQQTQVMLTVSRAFAFSF